jgi:hypothetical protein
MYDRVRSALNTYRLCPIQQHRTILKAIGGAHEADPDAVIWRAMVLENRHSLARSAQSRPLNATGSEWKLTLKIFVSVDPAEQPSGIYSA